MDSIAHALAPNDLLLWMWRLIVWAAAAYLLILGTLVFLRPALVHRFFGSLATTWRINFLEAAIRLLIGLALMGVSPATRLPALVFWFGAVLAITAIPLMFLHRLHQRQASWVIPLTQRILPLMGVIALALGGFIVWATV